MFETWKESLRLGPGWRRRVGAEFAILAAAGVLMGVLGPYDSHALPGVTRYVYWLACIVGGGAIGIAIEYAIVRWKLPTWRQVGAVSLLMTPPVALYVLLLSHAAFGSNVDAAGYVRASWQVFAIALPVTAVRALAWRRPELRIETRTIVEPPMPEAEAAFRRRLSAKRRGARLIAVEAHDHYLRVHTDAGEELLTLRFADALAELARAHGYRIHRSWWVAADAIEGASWRRGSGEVRLAGGLAAPISRTYAPLLKEAGWLR